MRGACQVQCIAITHEPAIVPNPRPELSDIALFVEVAKRRSFSRAGEALGIPNSSLSRRISRLEQAVGVTLLHRSSRRVELTELGRKYFDRCEKLVEDAEAAHEQLLRDSASPKGRIRMSVPVDFGLVFIAPALAEFARLYPELAFDVDMSPRRVDLVAERYDLVIRVGELDDSSLLVTRRLATVGVSLYASPAYLQTAGVPQAPADLAGHCCLRMLLPDPASAVAAAKRRRAGHRPRAEPVLDQQPRHAARADGIGARHRCLRCDRGRCRHPRRTIAARSARMEHAAAADSACSRRDHGCRGAFACGSIS